MTKKWARPKARAHTCFRPVTIEDARERQNGTARVIAWEHPASSGQFQLALFSAAIEGARQLI